MTDPRVIYPKCGNRFPVTEARTAQIEEGLREHLGLSWRDTHPSGATSIEVFHRWVETGDAAIRQRILDYNEDDCRATRVLLDGIRQLSL